MKIKKIQFLEYEKMCVNSFIWSRQTQRYVFIREVGVQAPCLMFSSFIFSSYIIFMVVVSEMIADSLVGEKRFDAALFWTAKTVRQIHRIRLVIFIFYY